MAKSNENTNALIDKLTALSGVEKVFERPVFHEAVLKFDSPLKDVLRALNAQNLVGGYSLEDEYPELGNALLVCATETKTQADIDTYVNHLERILSKQETVKCPVSPKI